MVRARTQLCAVLALMACSGRQPVGVSHAPTVTREPDAAPPSAAPDAAVTLAPSACPERSRPLREGERVEVVASSSGLREIGDDGATLRTLSTTAAAMPRYTPDRRVVFLATGRAEVRALSLEDCRETTLAALPRGVGARCGGEFREGYDPTEYVHSADSAGITADGSALCLRVMDRNLNMMNVEVVIRVALDGSSVARRIITPDTCEVPRVAAGTPPLCEVAPLAPRPNTDALPYAIEGNRIVRRGPRGRRVMVTAFEGSDVNVDDVSASGRWQAFSANVVEGDTISRDLLLFDAQSGRVHPITEGAFPPALGAATIRAIGTVHDHTVRVTGETEIRFLDPGERLWVGGLWVIPGERAVTVGGDLAR